MSQQKNQQNQKPKVCVPRELYDEDVYERIVECVESLGYRVIDYMDRETPCVVALNDYFDSNGKLSDLESDIDDFIGCAIKDKDILYLAFEDDNGDMQINKMDYKKCSRYDEDDDYMIAGEGREPLKDMTSKVINKPVISNKSVFTGNAGYDRRLLLT